MNTYSPVAFRESSLTATSLADSLGESVRSLKVGPIRCSKRYHGRTLRLLVSESVGTEHARRAAQHAARLLSACDGYEVTVRPDGVSLAVIALKPTH
jgi:hypothetical protein